MVEAGIPNSAPRDTRSQNGVTVWLTGLPGAGKSTTAIGLRDYFDAIGVASHILDGDALRRGLNADLGFSKEDRRESVRRAGEIALLLAAQGFVSIASLVSPYAAARDAVRRRHHEIGVPFIEVWLSAPIEVCERRGPRHLYERARSGGLQMMTGVNDPYEPPTNPELVIPTNLVDVDEAVRLVADLVAQATTA
jgi:bifunctional enzyme CysN/CysC